MKIHFSFSLPILLFFSACQSAEKPNDIVVHPLQELSYISESELYTGEKYSIKNEFFVMSGISSDQDKIRQAVKAFNSRTLSSTELKKYYAYIRMFYRETDYTPRNYKEENKGYFNHDRIEFHSDDLVLIVKWTEFGEVEEYIFQ